MIRNLNGVSSLSKGHSSNRAKHELSPSILPQRFPKFVVRSTDQNVLFQAFSSMLQQQTQTGCYLKMKDVTYQPTGSSKSILDHINLDLEANKLGLIFGKSGSGKTTLLQVIAGLTEQDSGWICLAKTLPLDSTISAKNRLQRVGMVFQFPERHFLGHTIRSELTFGWPKSTSAVEKRIQRVQFALMAVGLTSFDLDTPTQNLSDGYKRRLALAVQLVFPYLTSNLYCFIFRSDNLLYYYWMSLWLDWIGK